MLRCIILAILFISTATIAQAHFPFLIVEKEGKSAQLIFSDNLKPDPMVEIEKLASTKLTIRDAYGKDTSIELKKGSACYEINLPGSGDRTVFGATDYGVMQKGDAKPFRLSYYPKAILGKLPAKLKAIGSPLQVEIIPVVDAGQVQFLVIHNGKAAPDVEVTVMLPDEVKKAVKTDSHGLTPKFDAQGRFGVVARVSENKVGEYAGKKFEEIRSYATLVVDLSK